MNVLAGLGSIGTRLVGLAVSARTNPTKGCKPPHAVGKLGRTSPGPRGAAEKQAEAVPRTQEAGLAFLIYIDVTHFVHF